MPQDTESAALKMLDEIRSGVARVEYRVTEIERQLRALNRALPGPYTEQERDKAIRDTHRMLDEIARFFGRGRKW